MLSVTLKLYSIALYVALAGLLWGIDAGAISSLTQMVQFKDSIGHISPSQLGIYISCVMLSGMISSFLSGYVADAISRKYAILAGALVVAAGTTISASVHSFPALVCARLITGFGHGHTISVATIYECEIAPKRIRGKVATVQQLLTTIGVATGYFISYGTSRLNGSLAWRVPFIIEASLAVVLAIGMIFMPFSPRWLVQHGRSEQARDVLSRLRQTKEEVDEELISIKQSLEEDGTRQASYLEVFSRRYIRRCLLGIFLMTFEMLCGFLVVLYYAPILFTQAGFSSKRASLLASGISGIINIAFTIPSQLFVDKLGRRFPFIAGGIAMTCCFLAVGGLYVTHGSKVNGQVHLNDKAAQWAVITLIYVFVANFSWSWAVVIRIYACEIVPTRLRAKACGFQHLSNWIFNFVIALTTPLFLNASPSGPYFFSAALTLFATLVGYLFMPETKGKSLEEIEDLFENMSEKGSVYLVSTA